MKRTLTCAALIAALIVPTQAPPAAAYQWEGPCDGWRYGETVRHDTPYPVIRRRMRRLVVCVFDAVGIAGQTQTALAVVDRESSYYPWAKNPWTASACRPWSGTVYGSCGLAQHLARYWPGRVKAFLPRRLVPELDYPQISPLHPLANIWVTAQMVRKYGWGPWS